MNSNTVSPLMSLASSLESLKVPNASADSPAGLSQKGNFLNQLENMMNAVKKEAGALESMKLKIKEMEELKIRHNELKGRLNEIEMENSNLHKINRDAEQQNSEIRADMQRLNDIYNSERLKHMDLVQQKLLVEQELASAHGQIDYLNKECQKIPDLQKAAKSAKKQVAQLKQTVEEEKASYGVRIQELEKTMKEVEKSREEAASHFWNLTEEINATKRSLDTSVQSVSDLNKQLEDSKRVNKQFKDRTLMVAEDLQHTRQRHKEAFKNHKAEMASLTSEVAAAQSALKQKDTEIESLKTNYAQLQEYQTTLKADVSTLTSSSTKLQATITDLSNKNKDIISENQAMKLKLSTKGNDVTKYSQEVEHLKTLLTQTENSFAQKETDFLHSIKMLTNTKEELQFKLQTTTSQLEAISAQSKTEHSKHWEEVERLKNTESQLLDECEKLSSELSEKTVKLHKLETEKVTAENTMRIEASGANNMVNALRDELERRLEDLVNTRKERENLLEEKNSLTKQLEDAKNDFTKNDSNLKKAIESDRNKMKQEMLTRSNRIKQLETEKQEMLNEMNDLMKQISEANRGATQSQNDLEDSKLRAEKLNEQLDWIKTKNNDLLGELKSLAKVEQDLRDKSFAAEAKHKEELSKLNSLVSDTKKASGVQIIELNNQIKKNFDEIEELKRQIINCSDSEKQAYIEVERLKNGLDNLSKQHDSSESQLKIENDSMRRELMETRTKSKIVMESKAKVEMEVISLRNELNRGEAEIGHQIEINKELNKNCNELIDKGKQSSASIEMLNDTVAKLKQKISDLEDTINKKNASLDRLSDDCEQLERDGFQAEKRLRMQLNSAESEINELKPIIPMLQKELADVKTNFSKLQTSTSVEINNLMEELRSAEEKAAAERRKTSAVSEEAQKKINALQAQCDKRKEALDDLHNRSKTEKGDRELLVMQMESEIERYKTIVSDKESLIADLEKQKHTDRLKVHELNKKCDSAERDLIDCKTTLEIEQQRSQRLEAKLRLTLTTGEHAAVVRGEFMNSPMPEGMSNSARNTFSRGGGDRESSGRDRERALSAYNSLNRSESRDRGDGHRNGERSIKFSDAVESDEVMSHSSTVYRSSSNHSSSFQGGVGAGIPTALSHSNSDEYRPVTPTRNKTSSNSSGNDLRSSQSVPHLYNEGNLVSGNQGHNSPFSSPRASHANTMHSPVLDRVSQTLAARTTAESSKAALRQAQQLRNNHMNAQVPNAQKLQQSAPNYQSLRKAPAHDPYYDDVQPNLSNATPNWEEDSGYSAFQSASGMANGNVGGKGLTAAEECIERTKRLLDKRNNQNNSSSGNFNLHRAAPSSNSDFELTDISNDKTPNSGRSASKLNEAVQVAHSMYPNDSVSYEDRRRSAVVTPFNVATPSLKPVSPPRGATKYSDSVRSSAELGLDLENMDEEEFEEEDVGPYQPGSGALNSAGINNGTKKLKKKKSKKANNVVSAESDLMLPKLTAKRK